MKIKIGFVGYGLFSKDFVNLFGKHPDVEKVCVAELVEERRDEIKKAHPEVAVYSSYDEMLENADINCVAIFSQRQLHGPMVIKALKAGKHVYSAVPIGCTIEEIEEIVKLVKKTHLVYMMGETCYYYPSAIYCREKYQNGDFGKFVYAEAQYYHDIREMYNDFKHSGGAQWKRVAGIPPMYYPTHSISMVFSAINQHATKVSCMGLRDDYPDDIFGEKKNDFENPFSNETAVFRMSGGGVVRINEFRRIGINKPSTYITCFYGEDAAYDRVTDNHFFQIAPFTDRNGRKNEMYLENVSDELMPEAYLKFKSGATMRTSDNNCSAGNMDPRLLEMKWDEHKSPVSIAAIEGFAKIQNRDRLPKSFRNIPPFSHFDSHPFLVDDFCRAVVEGKLPPNNAWDAARYMIPGLIAHESALRGGELMDIPDFGEAPADFERLTYEKKDYYEED